MKLENTVTVLDLEKVLATDVALFDHLMESFEPKGEAEVEHFAAGGVYVKIMRMNKSDAARQHTHNYDHLTVVAAGEVAVKFEDNMIGYYTAPTAIVVKADKQHEFIATRDGTVCLCVHKVRDEETVDDFVKIPWRAR